MDGTAKNITLSQWNDFRKGDPSAFTAIMQASYKDLFKYGSRFTPDDELVKDAIQNIFLTLWKNRETLSGTNYVLFYLLKSLRREIHRLLQKDRYIQNFNELHTTDLFEIGFDAEMNMINDETSSELAVRVSNILKSLPRRQQEVVYLRFYVNADADQIAKMMAISKQSVYNLLYDALKKMKIIAENLLISTILILSSVIGAS